MLGSREADEIGPSCKFATAKVECARADSEGGGPGESPDPVQVWPHGAGQN
jgi:hypothetical protein